MIIHSADHRDQDFGTAGDSLDASRSITDTLFFYECAPVPPLSHAPVKSHRLARVAMLASSRVHEGFCWHNSCHELTPANWKTLLCHARPDYLLVESCFNDSARAWPILSHGTEFAQTLSQIASYARKSGIPAIFWHTLGPALIAPFACALHEFDIVACADSASMGYFQKKGMDARLLPWAFSPEQFNPLINFPIGPVASGPLFDGISRMMRFEHIRRNLLVFADSNLDIIDTGMFVPPYNLRRFKEQALAAKARGNVSQKHVQEWYKKASALISIGDSPGALAPGQQWRNLEAAACRCPVLHYAPVPNECEPDGVVEEFNDISSMRARYNEFLALSIKRERSAHLAWRAAHGRHTFTHRMADIHRWIGHGPSAVVAPLASIVVPSMRPDNVAHVLAQYERQTWPNKELVYVFNGFPDDMPVLPHRHDIHCIVLPQEYTTGAAMNAGIGNAKGEYVFRFDDDDLYGAEYVADRMIYFREFDLQALSNASSYVVFDDSHEAYLIDPEHNGNRQITFSMGEAAYGVGGYTGGSVAMRMNYARRVPFQEQAYASADWSILLKGIVLTPGERYAKVSGLNFCVRRNTVTGHTWQATKKEILSYTSGVQAPLESVFI